MTAQPDGLSPKIVPLLREIGDLKRVHAAHLDTSFATRAFLRGWGRTMRGEDRARIAHEQLAAGVAAARLGAIDGERLRTLALTDEEAMGVLRRALDELSTPLDPTLTDMLHGALTLEDPQTEGDVPDFARALSRQPRAGVTCPGRARVMLQPEENHADHSYAVAIYAGLLAPAYGADPARAWWFGMVHHLHSAVMPDAGFTGEMLIELHLTKVIDAARAQALAELPEGLRAEAVAALEEIADDATPEARAFHAADVIDRVLEIEYHTRANALTMDRVLGEYELVHDGPVKAFHDGVLDAVGLP